MSLIADITYTLILKTYSTPFTKDTFVEELFLMISFSFVLKWFL